MKKVTAKRKSIVIPVDQETKDALVKYSKDNLLTQGNAVKKFLIEKKYLKA